MRDSNLMVLLHGETPLTISSESVKIWLPLWTSMIMASSLKKQFHQIGGRLREASAKAVKIGYTSKAVQFERILKINITPSTLGDWHQHSLGETEGKAIKNKSNEKKNLILPCTCLADTNAPYFPAIATCNSDSKVALKNIIQKSAELKCCLKPKSWTC